MQSGQLADQRLQGLAAQVLAEDAPTTVTHITQAMLAAAVSAS